MTPNKEVKLVYADFNDQTDPELFAEGGHLPQRFPALDLSLVRNPTDLHAAVTQTSRGQMPFFWLSGDVNNLPNLEQRFPVSDLERCFVLCEEPYHESHIRAESESTSPFFPGIHDPDQIECWRYFRED